MISLRHLCIFEVLNFFPISLNIMKSPQKGRKKEKNKKKDNKVEERRKRVEVRSWKKEFATYPALASKLYGVNATIILFVFVLYCIVCVCFNKELKKINQKKKERKKRDV